MEKLKGYKTYLFAALMGVLAATHYLGLINDQLYQTGLGLLGGGGLAALRSSIK